MLPFSRLLAVALLAACAALLSAGAHAEPLEREVCNTLKAERQNLLTSEVKAALARGPDWVKDHLHSADEIEKVRQYLQVEAKVAFRCRTDGVVMPKPKPMELPDRKPPVPAVQVAEGTPAQILAGTAADSLLPVRKPSLSTKETADTGPEMVDEEPGAEVGDAAPDDDPDEGSADVSANAEPGPDGDGTTTSIETNPGPSQTVADSDKTAPPKTKATQ